MQKAMGSPWVTRLECHPLVQTALKLQKYEYLCMLFITCIALVTFNELQDNA